MSDFVILTDSSADLTPAIVEEFGLKVLPLTVFVDEKPYSNHYDHSELPIKEFYETLKAGAKVHTTAANVADFLDFMRPIVEAGNDLLYLGFSSGLSSTYQNGRNATLELAEEFPERKILAVDSLCASLGQGLFVYLCCKKRESGATIEECRDYAESIKNRIVHEFTVDDLGQLKRGGRISAATALVGTMLNIKPMLHVTPEGKLEACGKVRGRRAAINGLCEKIVAASADSAETPLFISHGNCLDEAELLAKMISEKLPDKEIVIGPIGPVIGAHSGQGTLAAFVLKA